MIIIIGFEGGEQMQLKCLDARIVCDVMSFTNSDLTYWHNKFIFMVQVWNTNEKKDKQTNKQNITKTNYK